MQSHKWYVVHTYSGYELKAKQALEEKIKTEKVEDLFSEILVPSENVIEIKKGVKKTFERKFFPGYLLVKMEVNDKTWHVVKSVPKITGFVGGGRMPPAVSDEEVAKITQQISDGTLKPTPKIIFEKGDSIRVIDGPFSNFNGVVDDVNEDKGKVRVLVSIFGRLTPVELDFMQLEPN